LRAESQPCILSLVVIARNRGSTNVQVTGQRKAHFGTGSKSLRRVAGRPGAVRALVGFRKRLGICTPDERNCPEVFVLGGLKIVGGLKHVDYPNTILPNLYHVHSFGKAVFPWHVVPTCRPARGKWRCSLRFILAHMYASFSAPIFSRWMGLRGQWTISSDISSLIRQGFFWPSIESDVMPIAILEYSIRHLVSQMPIAVYMNDDDTS